MKIEKCPRCGRFGEENFEVVIKNINEDVVTKECNGCRTRICHLKDNEIYILEYPYNKNRWTKLKEYRPTKVVWSVS